MKTKERIEWIDNAKAFACLTVVIGHLIQSFQRIAIDPYVNVTSYINWFFYLFHMPLFMCMSGYLYTKFTKIESTRKYKEFEKKKIINLLVPYITFYMVYIFINMIFSSSVNTPMGVSELMGIFNNPIAPYWFLYALLSIFLIIPILENLFKQKKKITLITLLILKLLSIKFQTGIYIVDSFMSWGIYFYAGSIISDKVQKDNFVWISLLLYFITTIFFYNFQSDINNYTNEIIRILLALTGIIVFTNLFKNIKEVKFLEFIKKYTMPIFLLHTIFAAGIRIVLLKLSVTNYIIHFIIGLFFGIGIPVLIGKISDKIVYTNFFFYPLQTIKELKEGKKMSTKKLNGTVIVTYRCNARCTMCNRYKCPSKPEEEISLETIKKLPKMYFTNITGGEPFIREDLPDIVRELYKKSDRIVISTNGFFTDRIIKLCEEFPNVGIRISIEGLEETNNKIRGLDDGYNKGYTTLKKLVEMNHPDVGFGMTVQDANAKDLVALYKKSDELNMEFATASLHNSFYFVEAKNIIHDRPMVAKEFEKLINELLKSNSPKKWFRAYFNHGLINYIYGQKRLLPCDMAFDTFFIDPYGDVMPCNGTKDKEVMGNLNEVKEWDELWNSDQAEKVRTKVRCCDRECWMIGSVSPAMHKYIWKPALWVIKHKFLRFFKKEKYSMYELPIVRDYRDGKVTKEELDKCSTCDMNCVINDGLSKASKEQLKIKSGEEIVDADIKKQLKTKKSK